MPDDTKPDLKTPVPPVPVPGETQQEPTPEAD